MKVYRGIRDGESCRVRVVERRTEDGTEWSYELRPRPDLFTKPPPDFEWAADGTGAIHLAAALLADLGADSQAMRALIPYFRRMLSRLPADGFEVSDTFLAAFAYALGANTPVPPEPQASLMAAPARPLPMPIGATPNGG